MAVPPAYEFTRICRGCKAEGPDMKSLFSVCEISEYVPQSARIDEMLMACTSVQVDANDGLPGLICDRCVEHLKIAYGFKVKCQETDTSLREFVKSFQIMEDRVMNEIKQELQNNAEKIIKSSTPVSELVTTLQSQPEPLVAIDSVIPEDWVEEEPSESVEKCIGDSKPDFIRFVTPNQLVLTCHQCGKVFTTLEGLKNHKRLHSGAMFKCSYCDKRFTRQSHAQRHEMTHAKHKLHVCKICNKTLTRLEHLRRHLSIHLKDKPFSCGTCQRGFNRSDHLEAHAARCKGDRMFICDICNRGFCRADSLDVHKKLHENQKPVLPTLDNIDNIEEHYFLIESDMKADLSLNDSGASDIEDYLEPHVQMTEGDHEMQDGGPKPQAPENDIKMDDELKPEEELKNVLANNIYDGEHARGELDSDGPNFDEGVGGGGDSNDSDSVHSEYRPTKSTTPKKRGRGRPRKHPLVPKPAKSRTRKTRGRPRARARSKSSNFDEDDDRPLKEVLENEGQFPCSACDEVFSKLSHFEKHIKIHVGAKVMSCKICGKKFARFNHLKRHMTSHSVVKPFRCEKCTKRFARKDHLQKHMQSHDKKNYECDICARKFSSFNQLTRHQANKHDIGDKVPPGEKKYECPVCTKAFTTEKYRDVHVKGHSGEKLFNCKTCNKCFLSKSHLTEHQKFHNEHSKKFLCSECGQRFIRNDYLIIHMRRHRGEKPFKCKFCGKGFPRTTDLTVHERYHTGEKTHLCTICGRGFGRAYNLTVHMRTHTGEKPYQCTYCDAAFAQGNDLKAHVRRHTGERFHCEYCSESFLMGYLLTQHKRAAHGLNVVSNIRRLQPTGQGGVKEDLDDPNAEPPITITLPKPVVPNFVHNLNLGPHLGSLEEPMPMQQSVILPTHPHSLHHE